jgi:hypothetical protein
LPKRKRQKKERRQRKQKKQRKRKYTVKGDKNQLSKIEFTPAKGGD